MRRFSSASGVPAPLALNSLFSRIHLSTSFCAASSAASNVPYSFSTAAFVSETATATTPVVGAALLMPSLAFAISSPPSTPIIKSPATGREYVACCRMPMNNLCHVDYADGMQMGDFRDFNSAPKLLKSARRIGEKIEKPTLREERQNTYGISERSAE